MFKYRIVFFLKQKRGILKKIVYLPCVPPIGSYFEFEDGWDAERLTDSEDKLHLEISCDSISIIGYGPQFTEEEKESLISLGWVEI